MSDGMTGVNIKQAIADLDNFREEGETIITKLAHASVDFDEGIDNNWASPKEVEFARAFSFKIVDVSIAPKKAFDSIVNEAAMAVEAMAEANGAGFNSMSYFPMPYTMYYGAGRFTDVVEVSPDGQTGMNIEAVKALLETFTATVREGLVAMESLPTTIALYDPAGELKAAYAEKISKAISEVNEIVNEITKAITEAIATEQESVITGVTTALDELGG